MQDHPNITATAWNKSLKIVKTLVWGVAKQKTLPTATTAYFTTAQSKVLIKYINDLTERGLPPTNGMVKNFAATIAQKHALLEANKGEPFKWIFDYH